MCVEDGKCQKYLFSQNNAWLGTNDALGAQWSCVKRCTEDGMFKMLASMSIKLVTSIYNADFDSQKNVTHMLI